jgi:hypothetical protein
VNEEVNSIELDEAIFESLTFAFLEQPFNISSFDLNNTLSDAVSTIPKNLKKKNSGEDQKSPRSKIDSGDEIGCFCSNQSRL